MRRLLPLLLLAAGCHDSTAPAGRSLVLRSVPLVEMDAIGDTIRLVAEVRDGDSLAPLPIVYYFGSDPRVVEVTREGRVRATGNGVSWIVARERFGATDSIQVRVAQVPHSLETFWTDSAPILSAGLNGSLPLACTARDRNGHPIRGGAVPASSSGTVIGATCEDLVAVRSGFDTITIVAGSLTVTLPPVTLAVRPYVAEPAGQPVLLDSFPATALLWAPSGFRNSRGETEIFVTGYELVPDSNGVGPGALHRLVSSDGTSFRYDGVVFELPGPGCDLVCSGYENVAVVPRSDGPGLRMFVSAGSSGTYGYQVFSAVSTDERTWTLEPGIRIDNGGPLPPAPAGFVPWPVGEGMVIDRLPGGEWRMLVGGYERTAAPPDRFEIVEYRSPDQLTWTYHGSVVTAAQLPATASRSVYSPSVVEVVPGLWRMFVTADDFNRPGGRSRIFSLLSLDRATWSFEAELLGGPATNLYYTALVNDRLYFLREDFGHPRRLASVALVMP